MTKVANIAYSGIVNQIFKVAVVFSLLFDGARWSSRWELLFSLMDYWLEGLKITETTLLAAMISTIRSVGFLETFFPLIYKELLVDATV